MKKCKDCECCIKGYFADEPSKYVCTGVPEPFIIDDIFGKCTEYKQLKISGTIYEDNDWIIQRVPDGNSSILIISLFRNNHFIEDIRISPKLMNSDAIDKIKEIIVTEESK